MTKRIKPIKWDKLNGMITDRPIKVEPICPNPKDHEIVNRLRERYEWFKKDNERCINSGHKGTALHYDAIIEVLNFVLGHIHNWDYVKSWRICKDCRRLEELSEKELQKIMEGK